MSVGWLVGQSVYGKEQNKKNQNSLIIFDYLDFLGMYIFFLIIKKLPIHPTRLNEGQWKTDKYNKVLSYMAIMTRSKAKTAK